MRIATGIGRSRHGGGKGSRQDLRIRYWKRDGLPVAFLVATGRLSQSDPRRRHIGQSRSGGLRLTLTGVRPDIGLRTNLK
ncbi:hypothetical protein Taro_021614 [Colocasia esculenta]|uniref:Uncharacterized protein n=1 Tax=Colocasia esculenta TaxID=4460 RepID=A0A843V5V7_COLES|nr:hypothetical protein [Colocasia esculenta]